MTIFVVLRNSRVVVVYRWVEPFSEVGRLCSFFRNWSRFLKTVSTFYLGWFLCNWLHRLKRKENPKPNEILIQCLHKNVFEKSVQQNPEKEYNSRHYYNPVQRSPSAHESTAGIVSRVFSSFGNLSASAHRLTLPDVVRCKGFPAGNWTQGSTVTASDANHIHHGELCVTLTLRLSTATNTSRCGPLQKLPRRELNPGLTVTASDANHYTTENSVWHSLSASAHRLTLPDVVRCKGFPAGNWTQGSTVTASDANHYTTENSVWHSLSASAQRLTLPDVVRCKSFPAGNWTRGWRWQRRMLTTTPRRTLCDTHSPPQHSD